MRIDIVNFTVEIFEASRKTGLQIWRVENFKPVRIAPEFHGQFYVGDSYIVLSSIIEGKVSYMIK